MSSEVSDELNLQHNNLDETENTETSKETTGKSYIRNIFVKVLNCLAFKPKKRKKRKDKFCIQKKKMLPVCKGSFYLSKEKSLDFASLDYPEISKNDSDEEIGYEAGDLPPGKKLIKGKSDKDEAFIFRDWENVIFTEFELDGLVASKRRISTFVLTKKWSKEEDNHLRYAVKIHSNNWQAVAKKMESKKGKNDSLKTADDCKRRWITLSKIVDFNWTQKAEDKLLELVSTRGPKWAMFSKHFEGLHRDKIRKHYNKLLKKGRLPNDFGKVLLIYENR